MKRIDVVKKPMAGPAKVLSDRPQHQGELNQSRGDQEGCSRCEEMGPEPVSVRIHDVDGKFQEERTYPRSADPRKSKG